MNPVSWLLDQVFGRLLRWAGSQWSAGHDVAARQPAARDELLSAMAELVEHADQMGRGHASDGKHEAATRAAEGRVAAAYGRIRDDELAICVRTFMDAAAVVLARSGREITWEQALTDLRRARDTAAVRARQLER